MSRDQWIAGILPETDRGPLLKESSAGTTPPYGKNNIFLLINEELSLPSQTRARHFDFVEGVYADSLHSPMGIKAKFCDDQYEPPLALQAPENNRCHIVSS